ncbi:MAG TPA: hypothetical protein VHA35_20535 [Dongiaceae bacterium]|jgi:hypothetical protein|nr:hypothetical protein [Dongiaceae bacterium]
MSANPNFAATPKQGMAQVSTANTNRDGTGTTVLLVSGGSSGSRIERVRATAAGTTTAGVLRWFLSLDGGTTKRLLRETLVTAVTPSTTAAVFMAEEVFPGGLQLPSANAQIYAATHNAEAFNLFAEGGDY